MHVHITDVGPSSKPTKHIHSHSRSSVYKMLFATTLAYNFVYRCALHANVHDHSNKNQVNESVTLYACISVEI